MRNIRELYRLKYEAGLSHERIARALSISKGVVAKYVAHAEAAQLTPVELFVMSEEELTRRLRPTRPIPLRHVQPDYAATHQKFKRRGMTLWLLWEVHVASHPAQSTYKYSKFAQRYRDFVARLRRSMRQVHRAGETRTASPSRANPCAAEHPIQRPLRNPHRDRLSYTQLKRTQSRAAPVTILGTTGHHHRNTQTRTRVDDSGRHFVPP